MKSGGRRLIGIAVFVGVGVSAATAAENGAAPKADGRQVLPVTLVPAHYDVHLMPNAEQMVFKGEVAVTGEAPEAGSSIVLNAKHLTFDEARLDDDQRATIALDDKLGRATFTFAKPYTRGRHILRIAYHGPIATGTLGFFAMNYDSPAGKRRTLATNLEPAFAREVLPCWDEPSMKATFTVTLDGPADRMALSNMPATETTPMPNGMQRTRFAESPRMSTYLLFVGIGDYERIHQEVDGVDIGIVVKRGDLPKARYALTQATALLHYYNDYFGQRYPLPKLDLIAAPGEVEGGSMENWGAIFYSQDHLLFDPNGSTERERQTVFLVVSHEMAHQWFGDLVTMAWWDNLWLNEGFARWMQTNAAEALHPEWNTGLQAADIFERGKRADAQAATHPVLQPVNSPEQALQAFDAITYNKGAAVITMLQAYVGAERFRDGVRRYMKAHAFGNTVDNDLWNEVQASAGRPVLEIEHEFTRQAGVPLIHVAPTGDGVALTEARFAEDLDSLKGAAPTHWKIPLTVTQANGKRRDLLLSDRAAVAGKTPLVNAGGLTYARVAYPPEHAAALAERMGQLSPMDQINLMSDSWALGESGYAPASNLLEFMTRIPVAADPVVWSRAVDLLVEIDRAHSDGAARDAFRRRAVALLSPLAQRLGDHPTTEEPSNVTSLRATVRTARARLGDAITISWAKQVYDSGEGSAAERRAALDIVAETADAATFGSLLDKARRTQDPQEKGHFFQAMAHVQDTGLSARMVGIALGSDAPAGSAPDLLEIAGKENPDAVWSALSPRLGGKLPIDEQQAWLVVSDIASGSADPARIADIRAYGEAHVPADARRPIERAVQSIKLNGRVRREAIPEIDRWLAAH